MTLGMITNNTIPGVAHASYTQLDTTKYVKFNITAKISLKQLLEGAVNRHRLVGVFLGICNALQNADDYMLDRSSFLYDADKIFVNVSTLEVSLICVPVMNLVQNIPDVGMLFKNIMFSAQFDTSENTEYVGKIINKLNNPAGFLLEEFKGMLEALSGKASASAAQPEQSQEQTPTAQPAVAMQQAPVPQQAPAMQQSPVPQQAPAMQQSPVSQQAPTMQQTPPTQGSVSGQNVMPSPNAAPAQNIPPAQNRPSVQEQQKPQKKGFGLFGSSKAPKEPKTDKKVDKKTEKPDKKVNKKAQPMANMAIPGVLQTIPQSVPAQSKPGQATSQPSASAQPAPVQAASAGVQSAMPGSVIPGQSSQPVPVNFGETTVLGGGAAIGETTVLGMNPVSTVQPYLVRIRTDEHIPLTKPVFRIGKERSYVDYFVSDNSAVSRSHANFINRNGRYYVVDTNSTNHTFVDNQQIESNVEREITHGMRVRLADEEFEFRAY